MVTNIFDILPQGEFLDMSDSGFIRGQYHPEYFYTIYNYSKSAQACRLWNTTTMTCRGLIINTVTGEILARPFPKFFNYGEESQQKRKWSVNEPVIVTDKLDGSLGISYLDPEGKPCIATRGSFTSDQAIKGTEILRTKYAEWQPDPGLTYLFEIIYPENRIVVDYGQTEDLVLLGAVNIETGKSIDPVIAGMNWWGPSAKVMKYKTFQEALEAKPRPNSEGLVVHFINSDQRVKLKQEDYVELHRIVSNLDAQVVWDYLREGKPLIDLVEALPEEFENWIYETGIELMKKFNNLHTYIEQIVENAECDIADARITDEREARKYLALSVKDRIDAGVVGACFAWFDCNNEKVNKIIWNYIKPPKEKMKGSNG